MKCWNSAFNAQGSKVIKKALKVGATKTYVVAVQELKKKKERQHSTQFNTKIGGKFSLGIVKFFIPSYAFDAFRSPSLNWTMLVVWFHNLQGMFQTQENLGASFLRVLTHK
jgi:hypothetical protein